MALVGKDHGATVRDAKCDISPCDISLAQRKPIPQKRLRVAFTVTSRSSLFCSNTPSRQSRNARRGRALARALWGEGGAKLAARNAIHFLVRPLTSSSSGTPCQMKTGAAPIPCLILAMGFRGRRRPRPRGTGNVPKIWALILASIAKNAKKTHRCKDPKPPILASVGKNQQMCAVRATQGSASDPRCGGEEFESWWGATRSNGGLQQFHRF
jgi:hypothetical protein